LNIPVSFTTPPEAMVNEVTAAPFAKHTSILVLSEGLIWYVAELHFVYLQNNI